MNKPGSLIKGKDTFIRKNDLLLLTGLLALALVLFFLLPFFTGEVTVDGKPYRSLSLTEDCEFFVPGITGGNHICIRNGSVSVTAADSSQISFELSIVAVVETSGLLTV